MFVVGLDQLSWKRGFRLLWCHTGYQIHGCTSQIDTILGLAGWCCMYPRYNFVSSHAFCDQVTHLKYWHVNEVLPSQMEILLKMSGRKLFDLCVFSLHITIAIKAYVITLSTPLPLAYKGDTPFSPAQAKPSSSIALRLSLMLWFNWWLEVCRVLITYKYFDLRQSKPPIFFNFFQRDLFSHQNFTVIFY